MIQTSKQITTLQNNASARLAEFGLEPFDLRVQFPFLLEIKEGYLRPLLLGLGKCLRKPLVFFRFIGPIFASSGPLLGDEIR